MTQTKGISVEVSIPEPPIRRGIAKGSDIVRWRVMGPIGSHIDVGHLVHLYQSGDAPLRWEDDFHSDPNRREERHIQLTIQDVFDLAEELKALLGKDETAGY